MDLRDMDLRDMDLRAIDLRDMDLRDMDLRDIDLRDIDLDLRDKPIEAIGAIPYMERGALFFLRHEPRSFTRFPLADLLL
jgi:hypothetical protein